MASILSGLIFILLASNVSKSSIWITESESLDSELWEGVDTPTGDGEKGG